MKTKTKIMKAGKLDTEIITGILKKGGLVIYPTETQYGIGADVFNRKSVKKLFAAKKRPADKKVIWAFSDLGMIKKYISLGREQEKLIMKLMPGPFTLVLDDQGFRIPDNRKIRSVIRNFGGPISTTSANISGKETPNKIKDIIELFDGKVDLIIDAGDLPRKRPSTVLRWEDKKILRRGPVSKKEIMEALKN